MLVTAKPLGTSSDGVHGIGPQIGEFGRLLTSSLHIAVRVVWGEDRNVLPNTTGAGHGQACTQLHYPTTQAVTRHVSWFSRPEVLLCLLHKDILNRWVQVCCASLIHGANADY